MKTESEIIADRDQAILAARAIIQNHYFILDTETTGLNNAQMCQLAVLQDDGFQFKSLVKPTIPIEAGASSVHHITDKDVENSPNALEVLHALPVFSAMVIYNAQFDLKILRQSAKAHGAIFTDQYNNHTYDAMLIYSAFRGLWDDYHGNYKWWKLGEACAQCKIELDLELHDALSDCIMTDRLIKYIASQKLSTEEDTIPG